MKQTKPALQFEIPLMPYSFYIRENLKANERLAWSKEQPNPPMETQKRANYLKSLGENYLKSKISYLL